MLPEPPPTSLAPAASWWHPVPGLTWQWQLDEQVDSSIDAQVYDLDLYVEAPVIQGLQERGARLIGYISVGSWENWRPDADRFPDALLGREYDGWPGERWLDIRRLDLLGPILQARLDLCRRQGFDAVEPDNLQIHDNPTGFPLCYSDQLAFARWLAAEAHARGLAIALKNAPDMVPDVLGIFDFAIAEDCFVQGWCDRLVPFIQAGKPVLAAEYTDTGVDFKAACAWGRQHNFSFILKNRILTAYRGSCP